MSVIGGKVDQITATWLRRPTLDLFCDSIFLAQMAEECSEDSGDSRKAALVEAAMSMAMFAIEASANCALEFYQCSQQMKASLDKLSVLDKFEFLLHVRNRSALFDRGRKEMQQLQELIALRNSYVHPKVQENLVQAQFSTHTFNGDVRKTKQLNIPNDSQHWKLEHVKVSIKAIAEFWNLFFVELCSMIPKESGRLFLSD